MKFVFGLGRNSYKYLQAAVAGGAKTWLISYAYMESGRLYREIVALKVKDQHEVRVRRKRRQQVQQAPR